MTWDDIKNWTKDNQGVIGILAILIPLLISFLIWGIKKIYRSSKKENTPGSINYHPEGETVGLVNITQYNITQYNKEQLLQASKPEQDIRIKIEARLISSQLPFIDDMFFMFEAFEKKFVIKEDELFSLIKNYSKNQKGFLIINNADLINLLKNFKSYNDRENSINLDQSVYDFIREELGEKNIIIETRVTNIKLLMIPFNNLSANDFDLRGRKFSMYLKQAI